MKDQAVVANLALAISAIIFGSAVVATSVVVRDVPPLSLAVLRYALGGGTLFLCLLAGARNLLRVPWRDLPYLALLGAILFAAFPFTFNAGLRLTQASRGALMLATLPFWSAVLARVIARESLTARQILGLMLTFAGVTVVLTEHGLEWTVLVGDGLLLVTALCGAVYGVLAKRAFARHAPLTVTAYAMLAGTIILLPAAFVEGLFPAVVGLDGGTIILIVYLGVIGGALGYYLWTFGLARLTPTQAAVYINLNPLSALALGAAFLGERVSPGLVVAFVVSLTGIALMNWPTGRKPIHVTADGLPRTQSP